MKKSRFTGSQINTILKEGESGDSGRTVGAASSALAALSELQHCRFVSSCHCGLLWVRPG
jgi:hypothetical protein